ncbi:MmyB family transcriptional regulator [Dactylosporangium cerinum]
MLPMPAFVEGRYLDVLAANPLATALSPRLVVGGNRLRDVFLDPAEQAMFPDFEAAAAGLVAGFRQAVGTATDDPRCIELVGELSSPARSSGDCGPATTCARGPARWCPSTTRRSASCASTGRSC